MSDFWFAECIPCGWQEKSMSQESAIAAAEDHVFEHHRHVPAHERGRLKMGHVQNRSENAFSTSPATSPATPQDVDQGAVGAVIDNPDPASTGSAVDAPPNPDLISE